MDGLQGLVLEVNNLVTAPYAVSLNHLHELSRRLSPSVFRSWADIKACQIPSLAAAVLSAIPREISALPVLAAFAAVPQFKDEVLYQQPDLLEGLLRQSAAGENNSETALECCVTILSHPYSSQVALPISTSKFLHILLERIADKTGDLSLGILRHLICCTSARLLEVADEDSINAIINICQVTLKQNNAHLDNLNCMVIGGCVFKSFFVDAQVSSSDSTNSPSTLSDWAAKTRQFFIFNLRSEANVRQTVLRLIYHLDADKNCSDDDTLEALKCASEILEMVDSKSLIEWSRTNPAIIEKFLQKASRPDLHTPVRFAALTVLMKLDPQGLHCDCSNLLKWLVKILLSDHISSPLLAFNDPLEHIISLCQGVELYLRPASRIYDADFGKAVTKQVLQLVLEQCRPGQPPSLRRAVALQHALLLVHALSKTVQKDDTPELAEVLVELVKEAGVPDWWLLDLFSSEERENCGTKAICPQELESRRLELTSSISALLVEIACLSDKALNRQDFIQLSHAAVAKRCYSCQYAVADKAEPLFFSFARRDRVTDGASVEWQRALGERLSFMGEQTKQDVVTFVNDVCRDLQKRCEEVERPLRAMEAKAERMQTELDAERQELNAVEEVLDGLRENHSQLHVKYEMLQKDLCRLEREKRQLQNHLDDAEHAAADTRQKTDQDYQDLMMDNKIKLMKMSEELDAKSKLASRLEVDILWMNEQVQEMNRDQDEAHKADVVQIKALFTAEKTSLARDLVIAEEVHAADVLWRQGQFNLEKDRLVREMEAAKVQHFSDIQLMQAQFDKEKSELQRDLDRFNKEKASLEDELESVRGKHTRILAAIQGTT